MADGPSGQYSALHLYETSSPRTQQDKLVQDSGDDQAWTQPSHHHVPLWAPDLPGTAAREALKGGRLHLGCIPGLCQSWHWALAARSWGGKWKRLQSLLVDCPDVSHLWLSNPGAHVWVSREDLLESFCSLDQPQLARMGAVNAVRRSAAPHSAMRQALMRSPGSLHGCTQLPHAVYPLCLQQRDWTDFQVFMLLHWDVPPLLQCLPHLPSLLLCVFLHQEKAVIIKVIIEKLTLWSKQLSLPGDVYKEMKCWLTQATKSADLSPSRAAVTSFPWAHCTHSLV